MMQRLPVWTFALFAFGIGLACSSAPQPASGEVTPEPETAADVFTADPQPVAEVPVSTLELGMQAPDFRLPGVDGKYHSLSDFKSASVLVVVFTCNHCPTAQAYEDRLKAVARDFRPKGVEVVAISPNSPLALLYEECGYSDLGDTFEDMKIRARDHQFDFPYLYDGDNQAVSIQYGPVATPHAFVFDAGRKLRYSGRLDGSEKPGTGHAEDLRAAIEAVLAGKEPPVTVTKSFGCSVKWAWKNDWKLRVDAERQQAPVALNSVDVEGIKELMKNGSGKLRLVNIWATWCGPCVIEFPELIRINRMYKDRAFEFVTLSADDPDQHDKVLQFLKERNAAVRNLQFALDDQYLMVEAVDPKWDGALPYTLLIEPGGKVVYQHEGAIDPLQLKRAIVDNPLIGRYY